MNPFSRVEHFSDQNVFTFPTMTDASNKKGSSSRLDRLLKLLESGSTSSARAQAAEQIGELVLQSCASSSLNTAGEGRKSKRQRGDVADGSTKSSRMFARERMGDESRRGESDGGNREEFTTKRVVSVSRRG
jgi:hypothetical protein